ncbi:DEAD-domain-containing protein [Corynespora cassiicola Philippines]|uniref:RNA helicase n=1 Tax=Corynespora cassiicola Philippines TaxID=1448308 RepID=A0A2T2P4T3_CORCC|nr:DEAD-domain-containing protein [Corynespora cassiicola Philippines]
MPAMKRKLNENDVPEPSAEASFASFGLEPRLLRGIKDQKWSSPTLVQSKAVPLALEGSDILARSGTGTGKTAAYLLPILQKIVRRDSTTAATSALILVPTKELAAQVTKLAQSLAAYTSIRALNIAGKENDAVQRAKLAELPHIVVGTPARTLENVKNGALSLKDLAHMVIDEGDLVMGYGFKDDLQGIANAMPKGVQVFLMSATLSTEVDTLQGLFCRDPVLLNLDDLEKDSQKVKQYVLRVAEDDKFLLIQAMFQLKLVRGKTIVFVGDVDRSYRVKLFLEQFGIKACVLNSELPLASRTHIVEEFNKGVYDILIASDETEVVGSREESAAPKKKKLKSDKGQTERNKTESGVARGIDFLNVSCVLNFDLPPSWKSYFHRIGRTARAGKSGTAISFVVPKDKYRKHKPTTFAGCEKDEEVLAKIEKHQKDGQSIEDYAFDMTRLEPFRYRFTDALRSVTRIAIREARLKEIRRELISSQKLSRYFEEHPDTLDAIKHDHNLTHAARVQPHLKHVPSYLLPAGSRKAEDIGFVGLEKPKKKGKFIRKGKKVVRGRNGKIDPLKTFNARGKGKK